VKDRAADSGELCGAAGAFAKRPIAVSFRASKGTSELGLSSTTDKQKEAAWRMEFEALGERSVLKNVKRGDTYNEAKRLAAFRWLFEQAKLRDRREARTVQLAWGALFVSMAAALIGIMGVLMALH
jgi:hypothetical protein